MEFRASRQPKQEKKAEVTVVTSGHDSDPFGGGQINH
jgi:hypothetical protein